MSKDNWQIDHEVLCDEYSCGLIEPLEFFQRMRRLGFDPKEIDEQMEELTA